MLVDELVARFDARLPAEVRLRHPRVPEPVGADARPWRAAKRWSTRAARYGVLIFEDVAYRELSFDGESLPSLWSLGPDVVLQAGTFSKVFSPGFRMGWALGPAALVAPLADAKQNTDQCAGALGPADGRGVRPRGPLRRRRPARAGALRVALGGAVGLAVRPHARGRRRGASRPAGCSPGSPCPRRSTSATLRAAGDRGGRRLRARPRVLRGRRRAQRDAPLVQPPRRGATRTREAAPGGRDRAGLGAGPSAARAG